LFKVIVAGSRGFNDYDLLKAKLDIILSSIQEDEIEIVSGTAYGADQLGECYAVEKGLKVKRFPADWDKHGKRAGYLRNEEMAKYADALVAFWDERSSGTKHMIDLARKHNLLVRVIKYGEDK
jgi:hypothetical protein